MADADEKFDMAAILSSSVKSAINNILKDFPHVERLREFFYFISASNFSKKATFLGIWEKILLN